MQEESGKMTAQEYLGQVEQKIIAVKNINSGINNLREILISIGGADSGERVQTSRNNDKFGSIFARIDEKERIMNEKSQELIEFTAKVENQICSMENPQYMMLLHKKYVLLEPLKQIATEMNFTYRYVLKMHKDCYIYMSDYCFLTGLCLPSDTRMSLVDVNFVADRVIEILEV